MFFIILTELRYILLQVLCLAKICAFGRALRNWPKAHSQALARNQAGNTSRCKSGRGKVRGTGVWGQPHRENEKSGQCTKILW